MLKMNSFPNFFFWDIVKILQTYYFEYFENAWSCQAVMIVSPCRHPWCLKCWNKLVGNFNVYLMQKSTSSPTSFLRYRKDIGNFLFYECLTIPVKIIVSICCKLSCLSACEKSTSSLTSFLRYCREIANLLFWVT